ncbi:MAG: hypothetical protein HY320_00335, partial [Armatimonadetes bacterium]|nr:hypothetical protein [Armatimonadota bacterium]
MRLALRALVLAGLLTLATSGAPASAQVSAMATFTRTEVGLGKFDYHVTLFNISSLAEADIVRARFALSDPVSLSNLHAPPRWGRTAATYASEPGTTFAEYWSFSAA